MVKLVLILLVAFPFSGLAQLILPAVEEEEYFQTDWLFNPQVVKEKKIKSVTGKVSVKHDNKKIRQLGLKEHYLFGANGQLTTAYQTVYGYCNKPDTLPRMYRYTVEGQLQSVRAKDAYGYYSFVFQYINGVVNQKEYWREESPALASLAKATEDAQLVKTEKYNYTKEDAGLKRIYLNENNTPYQEELLIKDDKNRLIEKNIKLKIAGGSRATKYKYDADKLIEKQVTSSYGKAAIKTRVYLYDEQSRLVTIRYYKNTRLQKTTEFVYEETTGLLKARLIRDEEVKAINIVEYTYTYW